MEINKTYLSMYGFNCFMVGFFIPIGVKTYVEGMYFDLTAGIVGVCLLLIANIMIYKRKLLLVYE